MSKKYKKIILMIFGMALIPQVGYAGMWDWLSENVNSWKEWATGSSTQNTVDQDQVGNNDDNEDEVINLDSNETQAESAESKIDFYSTLGIKFFPEQYLEGTEATLKKHLNTLFDSKKNRQGIAFFISLERKDHKVAINLLETMNPNHRLTILMESPAAFVAKILVDMRKEDFKGKTLQHWGPYEIYSEYFGKKIVEKAEIKGESIPLRYIAFIMTYNLTDAQENFTRAVRVAKILSCTSAEDLSLLLVYSRDVVLVRLGKKHESCFGAVKTKGYCDEETAIYLPAIFVGQMLNYMHQGKMISNKDLVNILEKEFEINRERFESILKMIDIRVIQDVALNFSEEILGYLPEDIILEAMPNDDYHNVLMIVDQVVNQAFSNETDINEIVDLLEKQEL